MSTKKGGRKSNLNKFLNSHLKALEETFQMLDTPAESSLEKVEWSEVTKIGDQISKQATTIGMLWNGEARELKELEESMAEYFNLLNGFILLCHGSTVCAGSTLHANIRASAKQVIDCSFSLLKEAVSSYGSSGSSKMSILPQLVGSVWEACTALKKTATTNCSAIGRAITQVAVSIKDILREMREIKPANPDDVDPDNVDDGSSDDDLGEDFSPEEMVTVQLVIDIASSSLDALKEVIRFVSGLIRSTNLDHKDFIDSLERVLKYCIEIGFQVNELGACVYPPQEVSTMITASKKIVNVMREIRREAEDRGSSTEKLFAAFEEVERYLGRLEESCIAGDLVPEMDKLVL